MNERSKILIAMMHKEPPDSKTFLNAQIAFMESLKARDRLEALFSSKNTKRPIVKKRSTKKIRTLENNSALKMKETEPLHAIEETEDFNRTNLFSSHEKNSRNFVP